jgi:hypothetical protein
MTCLGQRGAAFVVASLRKQPSALAMTTREEYLQPHFKADSTPVTNTVDRMFECAETNEECSLEEMDKMIQGRLRVYQDQL